MLLFTLRGGAAAALAGTLPWLSAHGAHLPHALGSGGLAAVKLAVLLVQLERVSHERAEGLEINVAVLGVVRVDLAQQRQDVVPVDADAQRAKGAQQLLDVDGAGAVAVQQAEHVLNLGALCWRQRRRGHHAPVAVQPAVASLLRSGSGATAAAIALVCEGPCTTAPAPGWRRPATCQCAPA